MTTSKAEKTKKAENTKKYIVAGIILAFLLVAFNGHRGGKKRARFSRKKLQCQEKYNGTTICNYDDHPKARLIMVTPNDKDLIVELHNHFRAQVEPPAANMHKMIYDEKLARFAQKWARVCKYGHDKPKERMNPEYKIPIGQNVAYGYRDWSSVINLWHSEVSHHHRGSNLNDQKIWTKQMRDISARIGCGVAYCPEFRRSYVCNYAFGDINASTKSYIEGASCSDCPTRCSDKLCDCKGKICLNGGTLKLANCKCKCPRIYGASMCGKLKCPNKDRKRCGKKGTNTYPKTGCKSDQKVRMECPYMCGLCKRDPSAEKAKRTKRATTKSATTKKPTTKKPTTKKPTTKKTKSKQPGKQTGKTEKPTIEKKNQNPGAPKPADKTGAPKPADKTGAPKPADKTGAPKPADKTGAPKPADKTCAPQMNTEKPTTQKKPIRKDSL